MASVTTRVFRSGNSEAVRLPKEVAYGRDMDVTVERDGDVVTIRPVSDPEAWKQKWATLLEDMIAIGAPEDGVQAREPIEWPDRPGLFGLGRAEAGHDGQ